MVGGRAGPSSLPIHPEEVMAGLWVREGAVPGCPLGVPWVSGRQGAAGRGGACKVLLAPADITAFLLIVSLGGSQGACACVCACVLACAREPVGCCSRSLSLVSWETDTWGYSMKCHPLGWGAPMGAPPP